MDEGPGIIRSCQGVMVAQLEPRLAERKRVLGLTCGQFAIEVPTKQRHLCGQTGNSEDRGRRLTCPIKEKWI